MNSQSTVHPAQPQKPPGYGEPKGYGQPAGYGQPTGYGQPAGHPSNTVVTQQPQQHFAVHNGARPSDYFVLSIISIFFCWPMGIFAITYSRNSKRSSDAGDFVIAESEGRKARNFSLGAIGIALLIIVGIIVIKVAFVRYDYYY